MSERTKKIIKLALSYHCNSSESEEFADSDDSIIDKDYSPPTSGSDSEVLPVHMLTTCESHDDMLHETGKVQNDIAVKKPNSVLAYNIAKKGVDYRIPKPESHFAGDICYVYFAMEVNHKDRRRPLTEKELVDALYESDEDLGRNVNDGEDEEEPNDETSSSEMDYQETGDEESDEQEGSDDSDAVETS
ncbi:hypothetical protein QE152_g13506 [Popillia japonica]|uniref:Uncharacterized protein n=1 Tax=Popillia japonica TaxID=7064 RepID=A0AAW1LC18_POPJA